MSRAIVFRFERFVGWEFWKNWLPKMWQTRTVVRRFVKDMCSGDEALPRVIVEMPWGSFRVLNCRGRFEPCDREDMGGM